MSNWVTLEPRFWAKTWMKISYLRGNGNTIWDVRSQGRETKMSALSNHLRWIKCLNVLKKKTKTFRNIYGT